MSRRSWGRMLASLLLVVVLAGCGDDGRVEWRGATLEVPEDWHVFEQEDTRLSIGNIPMGEDAPPPEELAGQDLVAMLFTHQRGIIPQDWRDYIDNREHAELEEELAIHLDGVPATRLIYTDRSPDGQPSREMVVVIPARHIEVLAQPVPARGEDHGPELFLEHRDTFLEVLESIEWGAPAD